MSSSICLGQLRSHTISYVERVLSGEAFEVVRQGRRVARIVSATDDLTTKNHPTGKRALGIGGGRINLEDLRIRAGRCFDRVADGETLWVIWRDHPVAKIVSITEPPRV
ncbi:type II toxin-antitoxin system Phd/YefM family antitoxin [Mycolicibacterium sp. CBMA 226]|uniref:type II toxin-antitoxin system Phd/YefM family antitoxin n=1 Tax=Mycolicibacterium sp. CBMA 226 TaxID=2606611 RepID=UPI0012DDB36E|nr:hypothetical protein [Mycolicibacterium sp. CBMA 226]MUL78724.1 hypothetical protein [Mycolicibacterium sp. CBMA 226]